MTIDFRVGGSWRFVEHTDRGDFAFHGEIREIDLYERIVQTFEFEGMPGHVAVETMVLEEKDGRTTITAASRFSSKEDRDGMLNSGMETGANQSYDALAALLKTSK